MASQSARNRPGGHQGRQQNRHHRPGFDFSSRNALAPPRFQIGVEPIAVQTELGQIRDLVLSASERQKKGYVSRPLNRSELESKDRCGFCGTRNKAGKFDGFKESRAATKKIKLADESKKGQGAAAETEEAKKAKKSFRCQFHDGKWAYGRWTCCSSTNVLAPGCTKHEYHILADWEPGEFHRYWDFFATPAHPGPDARPIIVLDCEMGTTAYGDTELIQVTAMDYFTGQILVDSLVAPHVAMRHYNTRFSGITRADIENARWQRKCFLHRDAARSAIWRFVGPDTIVVGHAGQGDLIALRWIHCLVVDTQQVEEARRARAEKRRENRAQEVERQRQEAAERARLEAGDQAGGDQGDELLDQAGELQGPDDDTREQGDSGENHADPMVDAVEVLEGNQIEANEQKTAEKRKKKRERYVAGGVSLRALAEERLGRLIQRGSHDSLEDAIATRDLLHWLVLHPEVDLGVSTDAEEGQQLAAK